jgi:hypothetical protein
MAKDAAQVLEEALALPPEALAEAVWRKEVETRVADLDTVGQAFVPAAAFQAANRP